MSIVHVEIGGRVQGVGFRWFVREAARRHGVHGWVRNREDGSVELAAEGDPSTLEQFLGEVQRGPRGARVEYVRQLPADGVGDIHPSFHIHR
jgi:acylphosphatase